MNDISEDRIEGDLEHCHHDDEACSDCTRREYFECVCHSDDHVFKVTLADDGDFYLSVYLHQYRSFFSRLWTGIKYIFGYTTKDGHWDTVLMDRDSISRMKDVCETALSKNNT